MFVRSILGGFKQDTKVKYFIGSTLIDDIKTVNDFLNNGLTAYIDIENNSLSIEDNTIIIKVNSVL